MHDQRSSSTISQTIPKVWSDIKDPSRLEALADTSLLGSPTEEVFDRFTSLASRILKAPVSLVSLVDRDHQFFKSQFGLAEPLATERRTPLSHSFCQYVVAAAKPLVVTDARKHPLLRGNGAIADLGVIAYLGIPLTTREGHTLGSFCTIDSQPRTWAEEEIQIMRDLANFVISEIELRLLARHFQGNFLKLRELEMERDSLVHMLVHDLRNPLSSLLSGLELAQSADSPEESAKFIDLASSSGESLLGMINDILDVSKSNAGRMTLEPGIVSPRELIELACGMLTETAECAQVHIEIDADPELPILQADREKIRRVLVNLVGNAIQHTPKKGRIEVGARLTTDRIVFSVADTGRGIPASAFTQIFEKFGKSPGRACGRVSSGLGLHFCKLAVEAHGGQISVGSEIGKGTTFEFDIPLRLKPGAA